MTHFRSANVVVFPGTALLVFLSQAHFAQAEELRDSSSTQIVARANKPSVLEQEAVVSHVESGKYSQVRMKSEVKVVSHDFFIRYAKDFGLKKDDEFRPVLSKANPLFSAKSRNVIRYQQHYKGLPVIGLEYVL